MDCAGARQMRDGRESVGRGTNLICRVLKEANRPDLSRAVLRSRRAVGLLGEAALYRTCTAGDRYSAALSLQLRPIDGFSNGSDFFLA